MYRNFFVGFVRIHILHHAEKGPVYGLWLIDELSRHGYRLSPGTVYPILAGMVKNGFLRSFKKVEDGRVRKYYRITPKGRKALVEARSKIKELVEEVINEAEGG